MPDLLSSDTTARRAAPGAFWSPDDSSCLENRRKLRGEVTMEVSPAAVLVSAHTERVFSMQRQEAVR